MESEHDGGFVLSGVIDLVFPFPCDVGGDAKELQSESGFAFGDVFDPGPAGGSVPVGEDGLESGAFELDEKRVDE